MGRKIELLFLKSLKFKILFHYWAEKALSGYFSTTISFLYAFKMQVNPVNTGDCLIARRVASLFVCCVSGWSSDGSGVCHYISRSVPLSVPEPPCESVNVGFF